MGGRREHWALVALLLAAPAAAHIQPPTTQAQPEPTIPPEVLAPNAEAQAVFETLREHPATTDFMAGLTPEQAAPVDAIIAGMFTRGETVPDWQHHGVNIQAVLAALPGGPNAYMSEATGQFGPYRVYPGDPSVESLIPQDWFLIGRHGDRRDGGAIGIQVGRISPKVIMVMRVGAEELGNASCTLHMQTFLYADPAVSASEMDTIAVAMTMRMLPELDRQLFCVVAEANGPGIYLIRNFDREGRRMIGQDASDLSFRIVPRAPFR